MHSYIEKVFAFVVAIGIVAAFSPSVSAANIGTADQFVASVAGDPTGTHTLTADIELSGWTPCDFAGTLDGAGHKITGLTGALFSNLTGTVKDLTIQGSATEIAITADADFGVLAVVASGATVSGCTVSGFKLISQQVTKTIYPGMGFFVGRAYDGCTFTGCTTADDCSAVLGVNTFCGGIVGRVDRSDACTVMKLATFSDCVNSASCSSSVTVSAVGNGAFGGILGIFAKTGSNVAEVHIEQCKNNGDLTLSADDASTANTFGGIVGKYEGSAAANNGNTLYVSGCENNGSYRKPTGSSKNAVFGGIVGFGGTACSNIRIDRCVNNGNAVATGSSSTTGCCLGGFVGYVNQFCKLNITRISNSINRGSISLEGSCNGAGGAFGYIKFGTMMTYGGDEVYVENCSFEGSISADKKAQVAYVSTAYAGTKFGVSNCWVGEAADVPRVNTTTGVVITESDLQIHVAGNDAAECTALNGVAAGVGEYLAWTVNAATTHPEPALPFTVRFVDWDGTLLKQELVSPGAAATAPSDPSRTGYAFGGWEPATFDNVTADMTIRAWYKCTVVFNSWDGQFASVSVREGSVVTKPATNPVWEYHTFQYWTLGGAEYDFATPVTAALTLTAEFTAVTYPVSFFDWNGNQIGETQYVPHGESAVAPTRPPDPEGMYFKKWSCDFSNVTSPLDVTMIMSSSSSVLWVSTTGADEDGRGTMAKPFRTVLYAIGRLDPDEGGTIFVMPGVYVWADTLVINAPIRVCGAGDGEVVFRNNTRAGAPKGNGGPGDVRRVVELAHKNAAVIGVSLENGSCCVFTGNNSGGGALITAGMVSNCVIRGCLAWQGSNPLPYGGGVSVYGPDAVLTHSVVTNCGTYFDASWGNTCGGAVYVNNGGVVQNTIVSDCFIGNDMSRKYSATNERIVGGIFAANGTARNCTVVGCFGSHTGGIYANAAGAVVNCAVIECSKIRSGVNTVSAWNGTAASFSNCAADDDPISGMTACLAGLTEVDFNDFAAGDFVPAKISRLVNHGKSIPEFADATDYYGHKRVVKVIDIGCAESQFVPGLVITGKRID